MQCCRRVWRYSSSCTFAKPGSHVIRAPSEGLGATGFGIEQHRGRPSGPNRSLGFVFVAWRGSEEAPLRPRCRSMAPLPGAPDRTQPRSVAWGGRTDDIWKIRNTPRLRSSRQSGRGWPARFGEEWPSLVHRIHMFPLAWRAGPRRTSGQRLRDGAESAVGSQLPQLRIPGMERERNAILTAGRKRGERVEEGRPANRRG